MYIFVCIYVHIYTYIYIYLRAAAPAADPETKHPERQFFLFLSCSFFWISHFKSWKTKNRRKTLEKLCCPPVCVDFIRTEDMSWYLVL